MGHEGTASPGTASLHRAMAGSTSLMNTVLQLGNCFPSSLFGSKCYWSCPDIQTFAGYIDEEM